MAKLHLSSLHELFGYQNKQVTWWAKKSKNRAFSRIFSLLKCRGKFREMSHFSPILIDYITSDIKTQVGKPQKGN